MAGFVKLDCGMLNSSIWCDRDVRDLFITALLMATPYEVTVPTPTIATDSLEDGGIVVPPGWYGFVAAAGIGIVHRSMIDPKRGPECLRALASPEPNSRSPAFEGRRMVRINGGFLILNYIVYRDRDYTSKDRSKRWRDRQKEVSGVSPAVRDMSREIPKHHASTVTTHRDDTQAEFRVQSSDADSPSEKEKRAPRKRVAVLAERPGEVSQEIWDAWLVARKAKRAGPLTVVALDGVRREANAAKVSLQEAILVSAENSWISFKAAWHENTKGGKSRPRTPGSPRFEDAPISSPGYYSSSAASDKI